MPKKAFFKLILFFLTWKKGKSNPGSDTTLPLTQLRQILRVESKNLAVLKEVMKTQMCALWDRFKSSLERPAESTSALSMDGSQHTPAGRVGTYLVWHLA